MKCYLLFFRSIYFAVFPGTCAPFRKSQWASTTEKQQIAQGQEWVMANHQNLGSCSNLQSEVQVWRSCPVVLCLRAGEANLVLRLEKKIAELLYLLLPIVLQQHVHCSLYSALSQFSSGFCILLERYSHRKSEKSCNTTLRMIGVL